jgi:hypothetical protein
MKYGYVDSMKLALAVCLEPRTREVQIHRDYGEGPKSFFLKRFRN